MTVVKAENNIRSRFYFAPVGIFDHQLEIMTKVMEQRSDMEHEVTYELLLTLLEHQFSSPVQWITTQDSLLDAGDVQRYVEIGPSDTLRTMLKNTIAQKADGSNVHDAPECRTFGDELDDHNKASNGEAVEEEATASNDINTSQAGGAQLANSDLPIKPAAAANADVIVTTIHKPAEIEDAPPSVLEVLLAMVSSGLKTARASIDTSQSIKFLAKGRSAVQNEIIGNLVTEFGQLPDGVEDTGLAELGQELRSGFSGKLGAYLNEWLAKKISAKLAPTITTSKLRSHLKEAFGLKEGRQNSFLLTVDFDNITSRLDDKESWDMVNRWANSYIQEHGLQRMLSQAETEAAMYSSAPQETASPQFAKFGQDLASLMAKHFKSGSADQGAEARSKQQPQSDALVERDIEQLSKELGPDFISGIQPYFRPEIVYRYQSSWNWAVQDLYVTLSNLRTRACTEGGQKLLDWIECECKRLRSRATDRMRGCAEYLLDKWERKPDAQGLEYCLLLLRGLLQVSPAPTPKSVPSSRMVPHTIITADGEIIYEEILAGEPFPVVEGAILESDGSEDYLKSSCSGGEDSSTPISWSGSIVRLPTRVCTKDQNGAWETNHELTSQLHDAEWRLTSSGLPPVSGTVLIIGAGRQSIGFVLVRQLLAEGCRVALCTSRLTPANRGVYSRLYTHAAKPGAELVLLPFNQGSIQDISNLVSYIHSDLGWEIDHLVPFGAIPETGRTLEDIDSTSELAHRVMLTNTLRMIGSIVSSKRQRNVLNHSTQILLPLSPNSGQIGGDGLYAESKLGLEALMNKWSSESWSDAISLCAVRIGWTRGTGLMSSNDVFAEEVEKLGITTFAAEEMAALLRLVMASDLLEACTLQPILCDFSGGMQTIPDLAKRMEAIRSSFQNTASIRKRLKQEAEHDSTGMKPGTRIDTPATSHEPRALLRHDYPHLPESYDEQVPAHILKLDGLVDLDALVVITGFAEVGPVGSSRTRWELEATGEFSLEGCVELAWIMGYIRYERHRVCNGTDFGAGWVECDSGEAIRDIEVKSKLEGRIREHTGIRVIDQDDWANADPRLRTMLHEVGVQEDLPPFECSPQAAADFQARHGDAVEILANDGTTATVRIRRGASIFIPKSMNSEYFVGAQVPTGWDAAKYGIPAEILMQVDLPSLFALVSAAEAFLSAGITDVYELYRYIHVSEVGNCIGSGAGGTPAMRATHEKRFLGKDVPTDKLSEGFIGTAAAWVNLLLLSASGPLRTPAGTCATSLESLDTAYELITSGRARVCLAGGYDVFTRPILYEFGEMKALMNSAEDIRGGREPREMSRPFTTTRNGFVLSEGIGLQVLTSASVALEMGLPIYGVVAMTHTAADKAGRSIPAPGQGILTAASQTVPSAPCLLMDPALRAKRIKVLLGHIEHQAEADIDSVRMEAAFLKEAQGGKLEAILEVDTELELRIKSIKHAVHAEKKAVLRELGHNFWKKHPGVSPIAGSLAVFGLTVDDITFGSLHGTATKLNDYNECATLDEQMRHLGRHPGNPMYTIAQKSVTGHGVGASGAWALNGGLQAMHSGIIPGNRNADDIEPRLQPFEQLLLVNENIKLNPAEIKAFSVTSFGFGQKGAQVLIVHPRSLFAAISEEEYQVYRKKAMARSRIAARELDRGLHGEGMFKVKDEPPYAGDGHAFLLNPQARVE
ncbi:hypothetical protein BKA64DRAFT_227984 [Cadophora sp. MPI-SDFR-AT-0126]|nr:hypothetical protein BKA64DRAFT_227984 [Leotiomycetes sp. MPI-SDFR-AT-0126]